MVVHLPFLVLPLLLMLLPAAHTTPTTPSPSAPRATNPNTPYRPTPRPPIIMLSTMDGTLSAFDARTGATLFTHRDPRPAVESWAAPGVPDYIPSLDGLLYRIDRHTNEAHVIQGKFISGLSPDTIPLTAPDHADAIILKDEQSSVLLIDLRTGRVLANLKYSDPDTPAVPGLSDHVIAVSRTSVAIKVVDFETKRELANASLVHNVPSFIANRRCLVPNHINPDAFVAYMTDPRDKLVVKSLQTGDILWSKDVPSSVVEAHGLGGVRIAKSRREAELAGASDRALPPNTDSDNADASHDSCDLVVAREGKAVYAMLAGPSEPYDRDNASVESAVGENDKKRKRIRRYHVANVRDPTALRSIDRPFGLGRLPLRHGRPRAPSDANNPGIGAKDAGWVLAALFAVGFVGYFVGSRPSHARSLSRRRVKRRRRADADTRANATSENRDVPMPDAHDDDDDDETDSGLEDNTAVVTGIMARGVVSTDRSGNASNDLQLEASNGSTGSATGGYLSNRTESGWMTVGCLQVSSKVLGYGSHGTVVYEGRMVPGERKVAVKRLLRQFFESARKEISLLVELDEASPHVVRYFAMEEDSEFIYLALELCAGSLAERVASNLPPVPPTSYVSGPPPADTSRAMRQLIQGLADLHRVGVVHRDVKPQNVLITRSVSGSGDVKLADVGLALRLADNRSSYTAVTNHAGGVGTTGWRAPEVLNGERQTKAVDIFAAGCVVSFVLTGGHHPFGNAIFGRDGNIVAGRPSLEPLEALKLPEATDIVRKMIDPGACNRPSADEALRHPFFWTDAMKLSFLVDISDRLYDLRNEPVRYTENLDRYALAMENCSDWLVRMDMDLLKGLGRQYENTASGLLRVIRNKRNHYSELSAGLRKRLGPLPEDRENSGNTQNGPYRSERVVETPSGGSNFLTYFTSRVPHLLMCVYQYAIENPALIDQPHFHRYGLKVARSREQMAIHPLVQRAREGSLERSAPLPAARSGDGYEVDSIRGHPGDMVDGSTASEVKKDDRRTYYRHELVAIQAMCPEMHFDVKRRAIHGDVYQPTAYARYKKRLRSNEFLDSDFDDLPPVPSEANVEEQGAPPGFPRVTPRRQSPYDGVTGQRLPMYVGSPGASRPPGFGGQRHAGNFGARGGSSTVSPQQTGPYHRRNQTNDPSPAPTVSQWSGQERVVDFAALRKQTR